MHHQTHDHEQSTTETLLRRTSHKTGSHIHHDRREHVHMHHIHRQLQLEKELRHHHQEQQAGGAHTGHSRDTPYRKDSHMEHYMSDILATPAPAALLEEEQEDTLMTESHAISMKDLNDKLEKISHLHNALQAQSNSLGDRRSSSESTHQHGHHRHYRHHHHHSKSHKHQHRLSEPALVSGTPIFSTSRSSHSSSRSSSPTPSAFAYSDSHRHSRSPSRGTSAQWPYYSQSSYSRPHFRSPSPQPMASPSPAYQFPSRPHSHSPSPQPSSGGMYHHANGSTSSVRTFSPPTTRSRTPQEALLQGLLNRLDQHRSERDQDRLQELELENEMLRRHNMHRINPDLLIKNRDHVYALSQNHGNANLRHS